MKHRQATIEACYSALALGFSVSPTWKAAKDPDVLKATSKKLDSLIESAAKASDKRHDLCVKVLETALALAKGEIEL